MKIKQLIKILQKEDPERIVILSQDEEGNYFSPLTAIETAVYDKKEHEIGLEELTEELREQGYSEEDVKTGTKAVILWP